MSKDANHSDIQRPRPGVRPVTLLLYPKQNYCRLEDPRSDTITECRLDEITRLNEVLVLYQLMLTPLTGTVGVTGLPGVEGQP